MIHLISSVFPSPHSHHQPQFSEKKPLLSENVHPPLLPWRLCLVSKFLDLSMELFYIMTMRFLHCGHLISQRQEFPVTLLHQTSFERKVESINPGGWVLRFLKQNMDTISVLKKGGNLLIVLGEFTYYTLLNFFLRGVLVPL